MRPFDIVLASKCRAVYSVQTYGELENAVLGTSSSSDESNSSDSNVSTTMISKASVMPPVNLIGSTSALSCGIDVEMVENFPKVDDYWKESFYTNSFSAVEIAYCLLQENPPMHFAARWCAKEALKKCEPSYMHEEMKKIELMASGDGSPILRYYRNGHPIVLPVAVSISHTTQIAVAVVCK